MLWNNSKTHFEITSANRDGVELNGTLVRVAGLKEGDVLRIGSADLIVRERDLEPPKANIHWDVDAPIVPVERREEATHNLAPMPVVHVAKSEEIPLKPAPEDTAEASKVGTATCVAACCPLITRPDRPSPPLQLPQLRRPRPRWRACLTKTMTNRRSRSSFTGRESRSNRLPRVCHSV